jgi:tetratricopeptide (TPR) repeat protein
MEKKDKKITINHILEKAFCLRSDGKITQALKMYSDAFNLLVQEAAEDAKKTEEMYENSGSERKISQKYLEKFRSYLRQDKRASVISNNMGVLFAQTGEKASAKTFFEQAIDLTPKGEKYDDPYIGLEILKEK